MPVPVPCHPHSCSSLAQWRGWRPPQLWGPVFSLAKSLNALQGLPRCPRTSCCAFPWSATYPLAAACCRSGPCLALTLIHEASQLCIPIRMVKPRSSHGLLLLLLQCAFIVSSVCCSAASPGLVPKRLHDLCAGLQSLQASCGGTSQHHAAPGLLIMRASFTRSYPDTAVSCKACRAAWQQRSSPSRQGAARHVQLWGWCKGAQGA